MNLRPAPLIFEVDERRQYFYTDVLIIFSRIIAFAFSADANVLLPLLHRLTSISTLPNLLVGGNPVGSIEDIRELHANGELRQLISSAGAVIDGGPKKKKKGAN